MDIEFFFYVHLSENPAQVLCVSFLLVQINILEIRKYT